MPKALPAHLQWNGEQGRFEYVSAPPLDLGAIMTDSDILRSGRFQSGKMKVCRVSWCTEKAENKGRLTMLKLSLKMKEGYDSAKELDLEKIGVQSRWCETRILDSGTWIKYIEVSYDSDSIIGARFHFNDGSYEDTGK